MKQHTANLGKHQSLVARALVEMGKDQVLARIWKHDHTVWKAEPTEITNRLGWLNSAKTMQEKVARLEALAADVRRAGYTEALLLGMGGSSLAPEVFRKTFGVREGYLDLSVLDSTDPGAVLAHSEELDPDRTLFIVSTKSGGTVETLSLLRFFYKQVADTLGQDRAGKHFIAITDPRSPLVELANRYGFRAVFVNDPNIGGRYSALSYFGLVPAAVLGLDLALLLERATAQSYNCGPGVPCDGNECARLGATLGELALAGRDKATFAISPALSSFGDWVEQLIAESTGKEGKGILPIVHEPLGPPLVYGDDRLFIHIRLRDDDTHDDALAALEAAGHPVMRINVHDIYDLGEQFFLWELAVAIAGHRLGINPFDQPNVESAKAQARNMIAEYAERGVLPAVKGDPLTGEALRGFLSQAEPGDYIAVQAYLQPTEETTLTLARLREELRDRYRLATTVGYGPRFLHSTGQLHKGDAGNGLFIQLTAEDARDVPIPDEPGSPNSSISFGVLKAAQALGDQRALLAAGRRVVRFDLEDDVAGGIDRLRESLS
jgi:glucose-6-phosphate isomerase